MEQYNDKEIFRFKKRNGSDHSWFISETVKWIDCSGVNTTINGIPHECKSSYAKIIKLTKPYHTYSEAGDTILSESFPTAWQHTFYIDANMSDEDIKHNTGKSIQIVMKAAVEHMLSFQKQVEESLNVPV